MKYERTEPAVFVHSRLILAPSSFRRSAFTLIEMLTTVAVLIIVLGLMVSLAREVRFRSAEQLTKELLLRLDEMARDYKKSTGRIPDPPPILAADDLQPDEAKVRIAARGNNIKLVEILRAQILRSTHASGDVFADLPISLYDGHSLDDAWGSPIVFMADQHRAIGMAPVKSGEEQQAFFFFSAGPDGRYLTRADNLYSYEQTK